MKICLLCSHQERSYRRTAPDVPYVCSTCTLKLLHMSAEEITNEYKEAIEQKRSALIYALASFVPKRVRDQHPCRVTKENLGFKSVSHETKQSQQQKPADSEVSD